MEKKIARAEWVREGRVPLQTLQAKINYCSYTVRAIYGGLRYKNLDICRRGIINPYLTCLYILFIDRTKNDKFFHSFFWPEVFFFFSISHYKIVWGVCVFFFFNRKDTFIP